MVEESPIYERRSQYLVQVISGHRVMIAGSLGAEEGPIRCCAPPSECHLVRIENSCGSRPASIHAASIDAASIDAASIDAASIDAASIDIARTASPLGRLSGKSAQITVVVEPRLGETESRCAERGAKGAVLVSPQLDE